MTNEIKEILVKDFNEILVKEFCTDWKEKRLYIELLVNSTPFSNLLDYITNLQNEIFDLKDTIQDKNDCIGAYDCIIEDRDKRIDKAVELLNEPQFELDNIPCNYENDIEKLKNILRGDE